MKYMRLKPIPKQTIWGTNEVGRYFGYADFPEDTGQTWCASAREDGATVILDGPYEGMTLKELWETHHELFQTESTRFPWIIGLVAPSDDLSVQIHPDDAYTTAHHLSDTGKNEGWYFLKTTPDSTIVYGHTATTEEEFHQLMEENRWDALLKKKSVKEEDFVYIPARTIHAMGKGVIVYEIQQNSNLTYRFYDYDRVDANGNPRQLHTQEALANIRIPFAEEHWPETVKVINGQRIRTLISCPSFELTLIDVTGELEFPMKNTFAVLSVLEGEGSVDDYPLQFGDHVLALGEETLHLQGTMKLMVCNEWRNNHVSG